LAGRLLLCAVVYERRQDRVGHYLCFTKRGSTWYECNDANVREVSAGEALSDARGNGNRAGVLLLYGAATMVH